MPAGVTQDHHAGTLAQRHEVLVFGGQSNLATADPLDELGWIDGHVGYDSRQVGIREWQ